MICVPSGNKSAGVARGKTGAERMTIDLWLVDCRDLPADVLDRCAAVLCPDEHAQEARYRLAADRLRFRIGHGLARLVSAQMTGIGPAALIWEQGEQGKPFWRNADVAFNLSHSGDFVCLAIGGTAALGVDVQRQEPGIDAQAIADFAMSPEERTYLAGLDPEAWRAAFFSLWVLREAALKATGQGVFDVMHGVSALPIPPLNGWALADGLGAPRVWTRMLTVPDGYSAALAVLGDAPPTKEVRHRCLSDLAGA